MANFIGMVYGTLKAKGIDTSKMSTEDAIAKFNELNKEDGGKNKPVDEKLTNTINTQGGENTNQTKMMSQKSKDFINSGNFQEYKTKIIDIDKVIEDNKILDDDSTLNTRTALWGNSYNDYKIDEEIYDNDTVHPIMVAEKNGKYVIEDGRHRMVALKNKGYKNVEVLVRK